jgi:hypothetical protein
MSQRSEIGALLNNYFGISGIKYRVGMKVINQNPFALEVERINQCMFVNQGQTIALVDQLSIAPTQHFSVPGELFEELTHKWIVTFSGTGINNLVFIYKEYV